MKHTYSHMTDDEFLEFLDNYGNGHTAIHEAAIRIRKLQAAQQQRATDAPPDFEIEEGYDAVCCFCHYQFSFKNSKSSGTINFKKYCNRSCENGTTEDCLRRG